MSARLVRDVPGWQYPGGSCHLRVWEHPDGWMVAILHEPAAGNGVSVANAMERILDQLSEEWTEVYGSRPMVVQHTGPGLLGGATWHNIIERNGRIEWCESRPEDQAAELEVTIEQMVPAGIGAQ